MTDSSRISDDLCYLSERAFHRKIGNNIFGIAAEHLDIRRVRLLKGYSTSEVVPFYETLFDAEDWGIIEPEQRMDAFDVDFFLQGQRRSDKTIVHLAVQVALNVLNEDIIRAARRADTLLQATGVPTIPVVIGSNIDQARQELAAQRGVTLIAIAD